MGSYLESDLWLVKAMTEIRSEEFQRPRGRDTLQQRNTPFTFTYMYSYSPLLQLSKNNNSEEERECVFQHRPYTEGFSLVIVEPERERHSASWTHLILCCWHKRAERRCHLHRRTRLKTTVFRSFIPCIKSLAKELIHPEPVSFERRRIELRQVVTSLTRLFEVSQSRLSIWCLPGPSQHRAAAMSTGAGKRLEKRVRVLESLIRDQRSPLNLESLLVRLWDIGMLGNVFVFCGPSN